eukprot:scaffold7941_cov390-Prasinococcus_capsulatus_cf.AAC.3
MVCVSPVSTKVGDELVQFLEWDNIGLEESTAAVRCLWCLAIAHSTNKQLLGEKVRLPMTPVRLKSQLQR